MDKSSGAKVVNVKGVFEGGFTCLADIKQIKYSLCLFFYALMLV